MEKHKLAFLTLFLGLALLFYAWYQSYPITLQTANDSIFTRVSPIYWVSIPLILASLCIIGVYSKNQFLKCVAAVGIILTIYSLSYFYFSMPTQDSTYFRGLVQNFITTKSLDPSSVIHQYYSWPAFFLLANVTTSISGLSLISYEFLLYAIIGSVLAIALYVYAYRIFKNGAFLAVAAFFVSMFYFLNYQAVPFSFALSLIFVLFMLETRKKTIPVLATILILFFGISMAHSFVALFFVFYLLFKAIISRSKLYAELCLFTINIFLITQFTLSTYWLGINIADLFRIPTDYSSLVSTGLKTSSIAAPIDTMVQTITKPLTITVILVCFVGFVVLLFRRKLRAIDGAVLLSGVSYSVLGLALSSLGERAIPIFFIPISLGVTFLFNTKLKSVLMGIFLIILMLFVVVPIHASFSTFPVVFQTKNDLTTANFMIEKYDWNSKSNVIVDTVAGAYISTQVQGKTNVYSDYSPLFSLPHITSYDAILYSVGLGNTLQKYGVSSENASQQILKGYSVVYNSGPSYIAIRSK